jgi:hypothetical protein
MSAPRITHRTVCTLTVLVLTTGTVVTSSSAASAHRGVYDSATCEESLSRVWDWPGELTVGTDRVVFFSDAYEGHVLRQPPCDVTRMPTPRWDPSQVGHQHPVGNAPSGADVR